MNLTRLALVGLIAAVAGMTAVSRAEADNISCIDQNGLSFAWVVQVGDDNKSCIKQLDLGQVAVHIQSGTTNEANSTQGGGVGNVSLTVQTDSNNGSDTSQTGNFNTSIVAQSGDGSNNSSVQQDGNGNTSVVAQSATDGAANYSAGTQVGDGNVAIVLQEAF